MSLRRVYETTLIINAALEDNDIDSVISKVSGYIENNGGEIQEINKWGRRRLAFPINKKFNGFYVHLVFETMPNSVPVLERFLVLEDTILRHLTLELSHELRDLRKQRAADEEQRRREKEEAEAAEKSDVKKEAKKVEPAKEEKEVQEEKEVKEEATEKSEEETAEEKSAE
jgi:small subunit ribosomal protein S6